MANIELLFGCIKTLEQFFLKLPEAERKYRKNVALSKRKQMAQHKSGNL